MVQVIIFSLIGGLFSLIGAVLLLKNKRTADGLARYATPFAAGVLLAAAFTSLLPEAMHTISEKAALFAALFGLLAFFMLERFLRFFHHHHEHEGKNKASNALIIIGDTLHNALDGVAIGAAFLVSPAAGIVAAIAVAAHEIPQEIGDFGLLLKNGMAKKKVLLVNVLSALATTVAAVITYAVGSGESALVAVLLAVTAGFFIYIASSDIIPEIHEKAGKHGFDVRPWLLLVGAALVMIVSPLLHGYVDTGHEDHSHDSSEHADDYDAEHAEDHEKESLESYEHSEAEVR
jgi:zinc and cadmium transporter